MSDDERTEWLDDAERERDWKEWVAQLPTAEARSAGEKVNPWTLYRMKSTGHIVNVVSIFDDGTVTVFVGGDFNLVMFEREVFGIDVNDLEPCEIPEGKTTGALLSPSEVDANMDALRVLIRPDLWVMGEDGKAVRQSVQATGSAETYRRRSEVEASMEKAMSDDPTKTGIFRDHNCGYCEDGAKPCVKGDPYKCEYPHARND